MNIPSRQQRFLHRSRRQLDFLPFRRAGKLPRRARGGVATRWHRRKCRHFSL